MTSTFALLPVSCETYAEIYAALAEAGLHYLFQDDGSIMLFNIAIEPTLDKVAPSTNRDRIIQSLQSP